MRITNYIAMFLLLFATPVFADYSVIIDGESKNLVDHPRILINVSDLDALRGKTSDNVLWTNLISDITGYMSSYWDDTTHDWASGSSCSDLPWQSAAEGVLGNFVSMGLFYQMYPNTTLGGVDAIEYATFAKRLLQDLADDVCGYNDDPPWASNPNRDYGSIHLWYLARIYDLIHNVDGDALISGDALFREDFLTWINDVMMPMVESHEIFVDYGGVTTDLPPQSNLMLTSMRGRAAIAVGTYEDNELADGWGDSTHNSETYIEGAWDYLEDVMVPHKNIVMQGGHGVDGGDYQIYRTSFYTLCLLDLYDTAFSDIDPFALLTGDWVNEQVLFDIYRTLPLKDKIYIEGVYGHYTLNAHAGDSSWIRGYSDLAFASNKYNTTAVQQARYFIDEVYDIANNIADMVPHYAADWFTLWDQNATRSPYTSLPESMFADGTDMFVSKTGWGTDEVSIGFRASDELGSYSRGYLAHTGEYSIYGQEALIINNIGASSIYSVGFGEDYNVITVTNSLTNYWGAAKPADFLSGIYSYSIQADAPEDQGGEASIDRQVVGDVPMRYARANLELAYYDIATGGGGGGKLMDEAYRSVVHTVEATGGNYVVVHDYRDQTLSGNMVSQIYYTGDTTITGSNVRLVRSTSRIDTEVLVPTSGTITETDVDDETSENFRAYDTTADIHLISIYLGASDVATSLVVHQPSNDPTATPSVVTLVDDTEMQGAFIADSTRNRLVMFSKDSEPPAGGVEVGVTTTSDDVRVFFADLAPSTTYYTTGVLNGPVLTLTLSTVDPGSSTSRITDSEGTLTFLADGDPVDPTCDNTPALCLNSGDCTAAGWNWCTDTCQSAPCDVDPPDTDAVWNWQFTTD